MFEAAVRYGASGSSAAVPRFSSPSSRMTSRGRQADRRSRRDHSETSRWRSRLSPRP